MNTVYILIVVLNIQTYAPGHSKANPTVTMQEFGSLTACKTASREVSKLVNNKAKMVCTPKGVPHDDFKGWTK